MDSPNSSRRFASRNGPASATAELGRGVTPLNSPRALARLRLARLGEPNATGDGLPEPTKTPRGCRASQSSVALLTDPRSVSGPPSNALITAARAVVRSRLRPHVGAPTAGRPGPRRIPLPYH